MRVGVTVSEFVKKTALGYKAVTGGYGDPELTHVILTRAEYDRIRNETAAANQRAFSAEISRKLEVEAAQRQAAEKIARIQKQDAESIEQEREAYRQAQDECDYQTRLNENLLRIAKERANADRKLRPKREHTGYVVISSIERDHSYKDNYGKTKTVRIWETVLQSPYRIDFTVEQARHETMELFSGDQWMIQEIGINGVYSKGYSDMLREPETEGWMDCNAVLEQRLRANYRAGYWELIMLHTKPLGVVPANWLP